MSLAPSAIRARRDQRAFEIDWPDGTQHRLTFRLLRESCPCAACIDEITGERLLDPATVPDDIAPVNVGFSGNYALKVTWSDRHDTGLYTWDYLAKLGAKASAPGERGASAP